jgi:hypothetical protein
MKNQTRLTADRECLTRLHLCKQKGTFNKSLIMQLLLRYSSFYGRLLFLLCFTFQQENTTAQLVNKAPNSLNQKPTSQQKGQSQVVNGKQDAKATMNTASVTKLGEASQGDYIAWLKSKEQCESQKTVDESGCVLIKYSDGGVKKFCNGSLVEVTTPNGRPHPIRGSKITQYVMKLDPPNNPQQADISYKWISAFNQQVLNEISKFLRTEGELNEFLSRENSICRGNIYKQLEYRTIFVQEYLMAR